MNNRKMKRRLYKRLTLRTKDKYPWQLNGVFINSTLDSIVEAMTALHMVLKGNDYAG